MNPCLDVSVVSVYRRNRNVSVIELFDWLLALVGEINDCLHIWLLIKDIDKSKYSITNDLNVELIFLRVFSILRAQLYCHYGFAVFLCDCRGSANRGAAFAGYIKANLVNSSLVLTTVCAFMIHLYKSDLILFVVCENLDSGEISLTLTSPFRATAKNSKQG